MTASNYLEGKLLDHALGVTPYTPATNFYLKLHLGDPGEDCTANPATNTTRDEIAFAAQSSSTSAATGTPVARWDDWGTDESLTYFSIWDASTSGNPLFYGALDSTISALDGSPVEISALTVSAD